MAWQRRAPEPRVAKTQGSSALLLPIASLSAQSGLSAWTRGDPARGAQAPNVIGAEFEAYYAGTATAASGRRRGGCSSISHCSVKAVKPIAMSAPQAML